MDLVLHNISEQVDQALRERSEATGTPVESVAADALARGLSVPPTRPSRPPGPPYHDLDWFVGSGALDPATLAALAECDDVHPEDGHKVEEMIAFDARRSPDREG